MPDSWMTQDARPAFTASNRQPQVGILLRPDLPNYGRSLCRVPLSRLLLPDGQDRSGGFIGDLGPDDHVVMPSCSRAYFASRRGTRCRVSIWLREPPAIQSRFYRAMPWLQHRFDSVLTYDAKTLRRIGNGLFTSHGGCWLDQPSRTGDSAKSNHLSIIASPKRDAPGHRLRHEVIRWATGSGQALTAFGKQYRPLQDKRHAHQPFRFSVVIENSRSSHYFTEKLIDCFLCHCLPIYWGCPEIADYFDPAGMLICENLDDLKRQITLATPERYQERLAALKRNAIAATRYVDPYRLAFDSLRGRCRVDRPAAARPHPSEDSGPVEARSQDAMRPRPGAVLTTDPSTLATHSAN